MKVPPISRAYSLAEDVVNSLTHGVGAVLGIIALVLLLVKTIPMGNVVSVTSVSIYGASIILLFLASTLYHAIPHPKVRGWLKLFDHGAIYLLIAGTYTPFMLVTLDSTLGVTLMAIIWSLAILGLVFKFLFIQRFRKLALITYLGMGWLSLLAMGQLIEKLPSGGLWLLAAGGLVYSLGVIFYVAKWIPYNHAIWHLFVLGGAICHFFSIYNYVLPSVS